MAALRQKLPLAGSKSNFRFTPRKQTQFGNGGMSEMCQERSMLRTETASPSALCCKLRHQWTASNRSSRPAKVA